MPVIQRTPFMIDLLIDEPGSQRCLMVKLFNFLGPIRPGTIFAIMHPWFKQIGVQTSAIQVENLQHVHVFDGNDPLIRHLKWMMPLPMESGMIEEKPGGDKEQGNQYFEDKNYLKAVEAYSRAIKAQPENAVLYSNRAAAYLRMEKSEKALQDTEIGLKLQPSHVKLLFRKAKALIQLKRYEEAASFLEKTSKEHKEVMEEKALADLVTASKRMVEESKTGNYCIVEIIEDMKRSLPLDNHAEYYAMEKFEMKEIPGKGRGLVAKETIDAGTLLMACKAFIYADKTERGHMVFDQSTEIMESLSFPPMVQKACQKLLNNPELGDEFYKLHAGRKLGYLENADHSSPVDIDRITAIIRINSFGSGGFESDMDVEDGGSGIWIMPSYMNHSCVDNNCFNIGVGDLLFVRAFKDIQAGEELLVQYAYPEKPLQQRRQDLDVIFQMECSCRLCLAERNEPEKVRKRMNAIEKILDDNDKNGGTQDVVLLEKLLQEVKKLRPNMEFNYVAHRIQTAVFVISPGRHLSNMEELFSIYRRAGHLQMAIISAKHLAMAACLGKEEKTKWMEKAKDLAKILYGDERGVDLI